MTVEIDERFRAQIPPLSSQERALLEENILAHGCRDPLTLWRGVLLDGHNRYEICTEHGLGFRTVTVDLPDREAAEDWIDANQLGRRNLTADAFKLLLGRRYNRAKKTKAEAGASKGQSDPSSDRTSAAIAEQHGVSEKTVRRAGKFAEEVESDPELTEAVKTGTPIRQVKQERIEREREEHAKEVEEKVLASAEVDETTMESRIRVAMQEDGGDMRRDTYRKGMYIVLLVDAIEDMPLDFQERIATARDVMNGGSVSGAYELVKEIVDLRYGQHSRRQADPEASHLMVKEEFMRAFGAVVHAMNAAPSVFVPLMTQEEHTRLGKELADAIAEVKKFHRNIMEYAR